MLFTGQKCTMWRLRESEKNDHQLIEGKLRKNNQNFQTHLPDIFFPSPPPLHSLSILGQTLHVDQLEIFPAFHQQFGVGTTLDDTSGVENVDDISLLDR